MTNLTKFIGTIEIPIRWLDLDAYGHVNNANYLNYTSEARIIFFNEFFAEAKFHFVVAETHCLYKKPLHHPNTIILKQYLKELGRTYMVFYYAFYLAGDVAEELYAECTTKVVCVEPHTHRIMRIPDALIEKLILVSQAN